MENEMNTYLNENIQEGANETTINTVREIQFNEPFEDPEENLGRLEEYFEFLRKKLKAEYDERKTREME